VATESVWVVFREAIPSNPIAGVFRSQKDALAYVDTKLAIKPDDVFEIGEYRVGVALY